MRDDRQIRLRGGVRREPPLLPIAQRANGDMVAQREFFLRKRHCRADLN